MGRGEGTKKEKKGKNQNDINPKRGIGRMGWVSTKLIL